MRVNLIGARFAPFAIGLAGLGLHAQPAPRAAVHFDVASVRWNRTDSCQGRWDFVADHGTVTATNAPLLRIISRAYNLTDERVSGPSWIASECYDIKAKASTSNVQHAELMSMLQGLLQERFHLIAHRDSEERPVFALLQDKDGTKMPADGAKISVPSVSDGKILFMAKTLPDLCERLGSVTGRPVIDRTGLSGRFMIVLTYLPLGLTNGDSSEAASDVFSAVRDQLGLRLEATRAAVDSLKVDAVEKSPAKN